MLRLAAMPTMLRLAAMPSMLRLAAIFIMLRLPVSIIPSMLRLAATPSMLVFTTKMSTRWRDSKGYNVSFSTILSIFMCFMGSVTWSITKATTNTTLKFALTINDWFLKIKKVFHWKHWLLTWVPQLNQFHLKSRNSRTLLLRHLQHKWIIKRCVSNKLRKMRTPHF